MIPKKRKTPRLVKLWRLRYRFYAILVVFLMIPILYADNIGINPNVDVSPALYQVNGSNILFSQISRIPPTVNTILNDENGEYIIQNNERIYINSDPEIFANFIASADSPDDSEQTDDPNDTDIQPDGNDQKQDNPQDPEPEPVDNRPPRLNDIVPVPPTSTLTNFLRFPKYNVNAPLIYTTYSDWFEMNPDGTFKEDQNGRKIPVNNEPIDSPVQLKLRGGVVHAAFTPQPGEIGNSYFLGHSSNWSIVKSNYNTVFKPLESKTQPGDEFFIYDAFGRELKFRVFEAIKIRGEEGAVAYRNFPDRRVVTLQTSIVTWTNNGWAATHRWITRGELVVE